MVFLTLYLLLYAQLCAAAYMRVANPPTPKKKNQISPSTGPPGPGNSTGPQDPEEDPLAINRGNSFEPDFTAQCREFTGGEGDQAKDMVRFCVDQFLYAQWCVGKNNLALENLDFGCPDSYYCMTQDRKTGKVGVTESPTLSGWIGPGKYDAWTVKCIHADKTWIGKHTGDGEIISDVWTKPPWSNRVLLKTLVSEDTTGATVTGFYEASIDGKPWEQAADPTVYGPTDPRMPKFIEHGAPVLANVTVNYRSRTQFSKGLKNPVVVTTMFGSEP